MSEKIKYAIMAGQDNDPISKCKILCGNIEQMRLEPFERGYDYEKNEKGVFITDLTGDLEFDSVEELIDLFYMVNPFLYPPIVEYGFVSKEEYETKIRPAMISAAKSIFKLDPIKIVGGKVFNE